MTNIRDTSLRALREHRIHLGHDQKEVFRVLLERGPLDDEGILEILRNKELARTFGDRHEWKNSDMPARRGQLMRKGLILGSGLVIDRGAYFGRILIRGKWRIKQHHFWAVWNDDRPVPADWHQRIEDVIGYKGHKSTRHKAMAETLF